MSEATGSGQFAGGRESDPDETLHSAHAPLVTDGEFVREFEPGGFGTVKVYRDGLGRHVAVKLPRADRNGEQDRVELGREARVMARVADPRCDYIPMVFDLDEDVPKIVMEYIDGPTLQELKSAEAIDLYRGLRLIGNVAAALQHCHAAGVIHRDVSPRNIVVRDAGTAEETAYLIDFGMATQKLSAERRGGTDGFTAPERIQSTLSDQYSLAAVVEWLFGEGAHAPTPAVRHVIDRALAHSPANRFESVAAFRSALTAAVRSTERRRTSSEPYSTVMDESEERAALRDADELEQVGRFPEASASYELLAASPRSEVRVRALVRRSRCLLETARWTETTEAEECLADARTILETASIDDPELHGEVALQAGRLADHKGRKRHALSHYQEALASFRKAGADLTRIELVLASAERRRGELNEALARVKRLEPAAMPPRMRAEYYDELGAILLARGEADRAVEALEVGLELDDQTATAFAGGRSRLLLAEARMRSGEGEQAKDLIQKAIEAYEAHGATAPLSEAWVLLGQWHEDRDEFVPAHDAYRKSFDYDQASEDPYGQAASKLAMARIHRKQGSADRARELIEEARDLIPDGDDVEQAALLQEEGELLLSGAHPNYERAIQKFRDALEIAEADGDERVIAMAKRSLARALREDDKHKDAHQLLVEARTALAERGDLRELDDLLDDLGETLIEMTEYEAALEPLSESLKLDDRLGRIGSKGRSLLLLGRAHARLGNDHDAGEYFADALEIYKDAKHTVGLADALLATGNWHLDNRRVGKAIPLLRQALEHENRLNRSPVSRVRVKRLLASAYCALGDLRRAVESLGEARDDLRGINDPDESAWLDYEAGRLAFAEGNFSEAVKHLTRAREVLQVSGGPVDAARCDRRLGLVAAYMGKREEALQLLEAARAVFEKQKDIPELDELFDDLAEVHLLRGDAGLARQSVERSLTVGVGGGWSGGGGRSLVLRAQIAARQLDFDDARRDLDHACRDFEKREDDIGLAEALIAFGDWYANPANPQKDLAEAIAKYKQARRLEHKSQDPRGVTRCNRKLAAVFLTRHEIDRAQEALEDAEASLGTIADQRERAPLAFERGRLAAARHKHRDAVKYLRTAIAGFQQIAWDDERRAAYHLLIASHQSQGDMHAALEAVREMETERVAMYQVLLKDLHPRVVKSASLNFEQGRFGHAIDDVFDDLGGQLKQYTAGLPDPPLRSDPISAHIAALAQASEPGRVDDGIDREAFWQFCLAGCALYRRTGRREEETTAAEAFAAMSVAHTIAQVLDRLEAGMNGAGAGVS